MSLCLTYCEFHEHINSAYECNHRNKPSKADYTLKLKDLTQSKVPPWSAEKQKLWSFSKKQFC